jgi:hypothetical protein
MCLLFLFASIAKPFDNDFQANILTFNGTFHFHIFFQTDLSPNGIELDVGS